MFWEKLWKNKSPAEIAKSFDLNSGMIEAINNPPEGFVSKFEFSESDLESRIKSIKWFENVGKPFDFDFTMKINPVNSWDEALELCKDLVWENTTLEAQNQLTLWLHLNAKDKYQEWNNIAIEHKNNTLNSLVEKKITPFQKEQNLDITFVHCVSWDIVGALMENSYLKVGHKAYFFLELLLIYEAGHFPCGWKGEFSDGQLFVF
jgi:hypothetical protein